MILLLIIINKEKRNPFGEKVHNDKFYSRPNTLLFVKMISTIIQALGSRTAWKALKEENKSAMSEL